MRSAPTARSVAQQVVQAGLGAGLGINPFDDDGGVQAVFAAFFGQVATDDDPFLLISGRMLQSVFR